MLDAEVVRVPVGTLIPTEQPQERIGPVGGRPAVFLDEPRLAVPDIVSVDGFERSGQEVNGSDTMTGGGR